MKEKVISWATTIIGIGLVVMFAVIYFQSEDKNLFQFCGGVASGLILMWFRGEWAVQLWNVALGALKNKTGQNTQERKENPTDDEN
jgi:hypothetical protein